MRWQHPLTTAAVLGLALAGLVFDASDCQAQGRRRVLRARNQFEPVNPVFISQTNNFFIQPTPNPFLFPVNPFIAPVNPFFFNVGVFVPPGRPVGIRPVGIRPVYNRDLGIVTYPGAGFGFNPVFFNPLLNPFAGNGIGPIALVNPGNPFGFGRAGQFGMGGFGNGPLGQFGAFR